MQNRIPPAVLNLLIINGLVFLALNVLPGLMPYFLLNKVNFFYPNRALFDMGLPNHFESIALVTYFFAHHDFFHILFNMLALWMFGGSIEMVMGSRRFMQFYLFCGVFAGLALMFFDPSPSPVLGASTSISGIIVAFAVMFPDSKVILFPIPIPIRAQTLGILSFILALTLFVLQTRGLTDGGNVSHFGHLAGMVGAIVYFFFGKYIGLK